MEAVPDDEPADHARLAAAADAADRRGARPPQAVDVLAHDEHDDATGAERAAGARWRATSAAGGRREPSDDLATVDAAGEPARPPPVARPRRTDTSGAPSSAGSRPSTTSSGWACRATTGARYRVAADAAAAVPLRCRRPGRRRVRGGEPRPLGR